MLNGQATERDFIAVVQMRFTVNRARDEKSVGTA
jgi:hypothetical protein